MFEVGEPRAIIRPLAMSGCDDRGRRFWGLRAWLLWVVVHVLYLIGFRNRNLVMLRGEWAYLTYQRGICLLGGSPQMELTQARRARTGE